MKYLFILFLFLGAVSCDNSEDMKTKDEVLDEYEGNADESDVYIVDTAGTDVVQDTLPVILETAEPKKD